MIARVLDALRVFRDPSTTDVVIDMAGRAQSTISDWLDSPGTGTLIIAF